MNTAIYLYMKLYILLLACIFETFRTTSRSTYGLDPSHYYTMPGYTFNCGPKYMKCKLETIEDVDMLLFVESGIRGGISQCSNGFSKANNTLLKNGFNRQKPIANIWYFVVNNLSGWSMEQPLPYRRFECVDGKIT